ncbi:heme peroxidase [Tricladium varicosporioides]|nr:heme peroxidase [Hymenoscyphus varicosporioides]
MLLPILATAFTFFQGLNGQAVDINGITLYEKLEEMERQMLNPFTLVSVVSPCSVNFNDDPNRGQQTSAEWVRIVFHDMITKNIAGPGLGGLDASIGFESDRPENIGIFVNVTLGQFSQFSSPLATCIQPDAPRIPLRVGRMDATGPGPAGVPGPLDSLDFAKAAFAKAGFSQGEMIQAIACGHSLGGVHHTNFPDIGKSDQRASFDSTPAAFDNTQVQEYLTQTGLKGGPLVTGPVASRSDFRIFNSDGNATITAMSSPQSFRDTCFAIFTKMINTVPAGTVLSDPIVPRPWLLRESHLDLNSAGSVTFSGVIIGHGSTPLPTNASYFYGTVGGGNTGPKQSQGDISKLSNCTETRGIVLIISSAQYPIFLGTIIGFGQIIDYKFSDVLNSPNINTINIQGSYQAPINQNIFILPSQSFTIPILASGPGSATIGHKYVVRAAVSLPTLPNYHAKLTLTSLRNRSSPRSHPLLSPLPPASGTQLRSPTPSSPRSST